MIQHRQTILRLRRCALSEDPDGQPRVVDLRVNNGFYGETSHFWSTSGLIGRQLTDRPRQSVQPRVTNGGPRRVQRWYHGPPSVVVQLWSVSVRCCSVSSGLVRPWVPIGSVPVSVYWSMIHGSVPVHHGLYTVNTVPLVEFGLANSVRYLRLGVGDGCRYCTVMVSSRRYWTGPTAVLQVYNVGTVTTSVVQYVMNSQR